MKIKIIKGKVNHSGKDYVVDDVIPSINKHDAERLIRKGVAIDVNQIVENNLDDDSEGDNDPPNDESGKTENENEDEE